MCLFTLSKFRKYLVVFYKFLLCFFEFQKLNLKIQIMLNFVTMNEETPRQKKIASVIQKELATLLQGSIRKEGLSNLIISITKVHVTIDLAFAKVFLSIFPSASALDHLKALQENSFKIRHDLSQIMKNQMRRTPQLTFYVDDSLDYIEKIDSALKLRENPITDPNLLPSKQKK